MLQSPQSDKERKAGVVLFSHMNKYKVSDILNMARDESFWCEFLGIEPSESRHLATTAEAAVFRIVRGNGGESVIVKVSTNSPRVEREAIVYADVVGRLGIPTPKVIGYGLWQGLGWITYEDLGLVPLGHSTRQAIQAVALAAEIHTNGTSTVEAGLGASHTPSVRDLLTDIEETDWLSLLDWLNIWIGNWAGSSLRWMLRYVGNWGHSLEHREQVVCHGDLHVGNILWSKSRRMAFVIDWEFLHLDDALFDLFQLLDATSPTTPLQRPLPRRQALGLYTKRRFPEWTESDQRAFRTAYYRYATIHLLWILTRIYQDSVTGRFPFEALRRQTFETLVGLTSLYGELR